MNARSVCNDFDLSAAAAAVANLRIATSGTMRARVAKDNNAVRTAGRTVTTRTFLPLPMEQRRQGGNWTRTNVVYTFSTKSTSSSQDARPVVFEFDLTSLDVFHASQHSNSAAIAIEGAPNQSVSQSARPRPSVVCWQSRWKDPEGGFSY